MALTLAQLEQTDLEAGWPAQLAPTAAAVEMAESSGDPGAIGAGSIGLFQIQTSAHPDLIARYGRQALLSDPLAESKAGLDVYRSQGWSAWTTYTGGQYQRFLNAAQAAAGQAGTGPSSSAAGSPGQCGAGGWKDATCGALDLSCTLKNWYGGISCSLQGSLEQAQSGVQIAGGLLILAAAFGIFAYLFLTRTQVGRQLVSTARSAVMTAAAAA